jgi:hypothetical protein
MLFDLIVDDSPLKHGAVRKKVGKSCDHLSFAYVCEALSPLLLHIALAFVAFAYCSDDLAIVSMLSHKRILT